MVKKIIAFLLAFILVLTFFACGTTSNTDADTTVSTASDAEISGSTPSSEGTSSLESNPAGSAPPESQPAESQPSESQPAESQPTESQPAEPKPTESKPTEPKPTQPKPTEPKPTEPKPTEPKPVTLLSAESYGEYDIYKVDYDARMLFLVKFIWNGKDDATIKSIYYYEGSYGQLVLYYNGKRYNDVEVMLDTPVKVTNCTEDTVTFEFAITEDHFNYTTLKLQDGKMIAIKSTCTSDEFGDPLIMTNDVLTKKK